MNEIKEKGSRKISEGIMLALISAAAYLFAFTYEIGFTSYFNIPKSFIRVSIDTILIFVSVVIGVLIFIITFANITPFFFSKKTHPEITKFFVYLVFYGIFVLSIAYIFKYSNWQYWGWYAIFIAIIVVIHAFFTFVFPLLTQRKTKGYQAKLDAQMKFESEYREAHGGQLLEILSKHFGKEFLIILMFVLLGIVLARYIGLAEAVSQEEFLVTNTTPEMVVLKIYGDELICAEFNSISKQVESNFVILKMGDDPQLSLQLESIGPLFTNNSLPLKKPTPTLQLTATLPPKTQMPATKTVIP